MFTVHSILLFTVPGFLGCYGNVPDSWKRLVSNQFGSLTLDKCLDTCRRRDFPYAALTQGHSCWCGDDRINGGDLLSANECNIPCDGNEQQFCGGQDGTSFYSGEKTGLVFASEWQFFEIKSLNMGNICQMYP